MIWIKVILALIASYLMGSIPVGYIVGKVFYHQDIRKSGSGNIGATNALRLFGTTVGVLILLLDMFKGFAVVMVAKSVFGPASVLPVICALAVILGHIFTIFLGFKGGKGVATAGGAFLALAPLALLITLITFIIITALTRYVSVGSILGALVFGAIVWFQQLSLDQPNYLMAIFCSLVVLMIVYKHKTNIGRLLKGTENKIKFTKKGNA